MAVGGGLSSHPQQSIDPPQSRGSRGGPPSVEPIELTVYDQDDARVRCRTNCGRLERHPPLCIPGFRRDPPCHAQSTATPLRVLPEKEEWPAVAAGGRGMCTGVQLARGKGAGVHPHHPSVGRASNPTMHRGDGGRPTRCVGHDWTPGSRFTPYPHARFCSRTSNSPLSLIIYGEFDWLDTPAITQKTARR